MAVAHPPAVAALHSTDLAVAALVDDAGSLHIPENSAASVEDGMVLKIFEYSIRIPINITQHIVFKSSC